MKKKKIITITAIVLAVAAVAGVIAFFANRQPSKEVMVVPVMNIYTSYWGDSGAGARRRYYTITAAGKEACFRLLGEWRETKEIMDKLLEVEGEL